MAEDDQLKQLAGWIDAQRQIGGLRVHSARLFVDERTDGESVTRVLLLVEDPPGETWELAKVGELRRAVRQKALQLDLPGVSVTLVPESEGELLEAS